jgi:hypothetical protein
MDEMQIWDYERTADEIMQAKNRLLQGNEPGLVSYWRFDEGSGTTSVDLSNHGNNAVLNRVWWITSTAPIW